MLPLSNLHKKCVSNGESDKIYLRNLSCKYCDLGLSCDFWKYLVHIRFVMIGVSISVWYIVLWHSILSWFQNNYMKMQLCNSEVNLTNNIHMIMDKTKCAHLRVTYRFCQTRALLLHFLFSEISNLVKREDL